MKEPYFLPQSEELLAIFEMISSKAGYTLGDKTSAATLAWLEARGREKGFGNGRAARNLFEAAMARHATRIASIETPTDAELTTLLPADVAGVEASVDWRAKRG